MNCQWNDKIHAFFDGELPPAAREQAEAHLKGCAECARELERLRRVNRFLNAAKLPIDELALARVRSKIWAERQSPRVLRLAGWLTVAASVVILACGAALFSPREQARPSRTPAWAKWAVAPTAEAAASNESDELLSLMLTGTRDDVRD